MKVDYIEDSENGIISQANISFVDLVLTTNNYLFTLALKENTALQNFAINSSIVYSTQRKNKNVILTKSTISGTTATRVGGVEINNAGHGQTLEYISKGSYVGSLLFSFNAFEDVNNNVWSTEIGILDLSKVDFEKENASYNYSIFKRFTDFEYATASGNSSGALLRVDAALSTDQSTILIWKRGVSVYNEFIGYDFSTFCSELKNATTNTVSFKNNETMKKACKFYFTDENIDGLPTSFQGIELSNVSNGIYSIYTASGNENNTTNRIYRLNSSGLLKKAGKIVHHYFNPGVQYEIEGIKISGDNL